MKDFVAPHTPFTKPQEPRALPAGAYHPETQTLTIVDPYGKQRVMNFGLRPGTFEHLTLDNLTVVALFLRNNEKSRTTLRRYTAELEKFFVFMQLEGYHAIDEWVLGDYQQKLLAPTPEMMTHPVVTFTPTKPETVDQYFAVIRAFVTQLQEKRLLDYNPARLVRNIGVREQQDKEVVRKFTDRQWPVLLNTLNALPETTPGQRHRKARLQFCIVFGYALGLRISEQCSHGQHQIECRNGDWTIRIIGKGYKARSLSLAAVDGLAWKALVRYRRTLGLLDEPQGEPIPLLPRANPVVIKRRGPNQGIHIDERPIQPSGWETQFKAFLRNEVMTYLYGGDDERKAEAFEQEWSHLTPHSLRHTRITHLVEKGKELLWVKRFAGHENLNTTARYFHTQT